MVKIILATSNKGKIKEFQKLIDGKYEVIPFSEILGKQNIIEDGDTFKKNAVIKAKAIYDMLKDKKGYEDSIVISDDSGISVPAFNGEPGIYSARYAGVGASDKENLEKLVEKLKTEKLKKADAYYTACIAIIKDEQIYTVHGWMYGEVIDESRGDNGFGYDPIFIPKGYNKTLGELEHSVKKSFSHRSLALKNAKKILEVIL